jgi:hypothetical protein
MKEEGEGDLNPTTGKKKPNKKVRGLKPNNSED